MTTIGIIPNLLNERAMRAVDKLSEWLEDKDIPYILLKTTNFDNHMNMSDVEDREIEKIAENSDLIITLGGDGTLLATSRSAARAKTPVLPINVGAMGFLSESSEKELEMIVNGILEDDYHIERRMMLEAELNSKKYLALNDVVVHRGESPQMAHIVIHREDKVPISFAGDGIIIATPTGSTAYSLSASGPVIDPSIEALMFTPICPHALFIHPFLLPTSEEFEIIARIASRSKLTVTVDDKSLDGLGWDDTLIVRKSECDLEIIRYGDWELFKMLQKRMDWKDVRMDKVFDDFEEDR